MMTHMKNLLTILLILLPLSAFAWGVVSISGGVASAPAGCTSCSPATAQFNSNKTTTAGSFGAYTIAWEFTLASNKCITGISCEVFDTGNGGNIIYEIWSGTHAGGPTAVIDGCSVAVDGTSIPNTYTQGSETAGTFASIQSLAAGTYFVVVRRGTMTNWGYGYVSESGQNFWAYSGGTWAEIGYPGQVRVLGCDQ